MILLSLMLFVGQLESEIQTEAAPQELQSLSSLDAAILTHRLKRIYGPYGSPKKTDWNVSMGGKTEAWVWDGKSFSCPHKEEWDCSLWVPKSFEWWLSKGAWLDNWVSFTRTGFFLEQDQLNKSSKRAGLRNIDDLIPSQEGEGVELAPLPSAEEREEEDDVVEIGGKKQASEVWDWVSQSGENIKVYSSLRNQWIERIDYDDSREYIEWIKPSRWAPMEIKSVTLDRDGQRISYQISKKKK